MMFDGWGMGMAGLMFMGFFWFVLIGLGVWAAVTLTSPNRAAGRRDDPAEILDRRFAMGELDVEQYRQACAELAAARPERQR